MSPSRSPSGPTYTQLSGGARQTTYHNPSPATASPGKKKTTQIDWLCNFYVFNSVCQSIISLFSNEIMYLFN